MLIVNLECCDVGGARPYVVWLETPVKFTFACAHCSFMKELYDNVGHAYACPICEGIMRCVGHVVGEKDV